MAQAVAIAFLLCLVACCFLLAFIRGADARRVGEADSEDLGEAAQRG